MSESKPDTVAGQRDSNGKFLEGNTIGWQPGESGNPAGGPRKEVSLTARAREILEQDPERLEKMAETWLKQVEEGKTEARRDLQDRTEGTSPKVIEVSGPGGAPIKVTGVEVIGLKDDKGG